MRMTARVATQKRCLSSLTILEKFGKYHPWKMTSSENSTSSLKAMISKQTASTFYSNNKSRITRTPSRTLWSRQQIESCKTRSRRRTDLSRSSTKMTIWGLVGLLRGCKWLCTGIAKRTCPTMIAPTTRRVIVDGMTTPMAAKGAPVKSTLVKDESSIKLPCKSSPRLCAKWCQTLMEKLLKLPQAQQLRSRRKVTMER